MTEATAPDLTPPVKPNRAVPKAPKAPKEAVAKEPKTPKTPKAAKPKGNYGYHPDATIHIVEGEGANYRGQRADWFEILKQYDGRLVKEFTEANKGRVNGKGTIQPPAGWLRFYVLDGSITLSGGPKAVEAPAEAEPTEPTNAVPEDMPQI